MAKEEGENILSKVELKVEYGEEPKYSENRRVFKTVGDHEHTEILELYIEGMQGMHPIAKLKGRSTSTIRSQIAGHDEAVARVGFCARCRRVHGKFEKKPTK